MSSMSTSLSDGKSFEVLLGQLLQLLANFSLSDPDAGRRAMWLDLLHRVNNEDTHTRAAALRKLSKLIDDRVLPADQSAKLLVCC